MTVKLLIGIVIGIALFFWILGRWLNKDEDPSYDYEEDFLDNYDK